MTTATLPKNVRSSIFTSPIQHHNANPNDAAKQQIVNGTNGVMVASAGTIVNVVQGGVTTLNPLAPLVQLSITGSGKGMKGGL